MKDSEKTKEQLLEEIVSLRRRLEEFEKRQEKILIDTRKAKRGEVKYRELVELANDGIYIISRTGFDYVNPAFEILTGFSSKELCRREFDFWRLILPADRSLIEHRAESRIKGEKIPSCYEFRIIAKDGSIKYVEATTVDIGEGTEFRVVGILRDVTNRKEAETNLKQALIQKDILLQEIHHRVKNNMHMINSLLTLQSRYVKDRLSLEIFRETKDRIRSLALIHERLHQSEDMGRVEFGDYIKGLTDHLFRSHFLDLKDIKLKVDIKEVYLDINTAIPCGLLVNELVSNSLKHAFPIRNRGEIKLALQRKNNEKYLMSVSDDGVGLPKDLDFRKTDSLGLQLVNMLVQQLGGEIQLIQKNGTHFKITFKECVRNA